MDMGLTVDFKVKHGDNRGIYYAETSRALIFLPMHESIDDIIKTINHEVYHHCFEDNGETEKMDEEMEESLIYSFAWAEYSL
jgi:hypothetical protein